MLKLIEIHNAREETTNFITNTNTIKFNENIYFSIETCDPDISFLKDDFSDFMEGTMTMRRINENGNVKWVSPIYISTTQTEKMEILYKRFLRKSKFKTLLNENN